MNQSSLLFSRRDFVRFGSAVSLTALGSCLATDSPVRMTQRPLIPPLIGSPRQFGNSGVTVSISQWPFGADAAAMISVDDFCPVDLGDPYDFGGSWVLPGGAMPPIEQLLIDNAFGLYPGVSLQLNTITADQYDPRDSGELPSAARLSEAGDWCAVVQALQRNLPGLSLGWHGWSHYNAAMRNVEEFLAYDSKATASALDAMEEEGAASGLQFGVGFRPPGWAVTPHLLDQLAERNYVLLDSSTMSTYQGIYPGYFQTPGGKWLFAVSTSFTPSALDIMKAGGLVVIHHHMTAPNANTLSDPVQRQSVLNFLAAYYDYQPIKLAWLSASQIKKAYDASAATVWTAGLDGGRVTISAPRTEPIAEGITWVVRGSTVTDVALDGPPNTRWTVMESPNVLKLVVIG